MPNADDTKPIDLDAIEALLLKSERATAFAVAILGPGSNEPADSLMAAVRALLAEVRRVATERDEVFGESLVACAILGADPTAPDYDYLATLRAAVKERNELRALQAEQQRAFAEGLRVANKAARTEGQQAERARVAAFLGKQAEQAAAKGQEVGADAFAWAADRVRDGRYLPVEVTAEPES